MGYRKVYLTIDEEEDIERIKSMRENDGRPGAAYNAILKEGLAMVLGQELTLRSKAVASEVSDSSRRVRRRRG